MNVLNRAARAIFLIAAPIALVSPIAAQNTHNGNGTEISIPDPQALQTGDEVPWLYRDSDVPVDDQWLFGEMDNGLRYAVRRNGVPPGQMSIRVRVDAGSLHEREWEQGYAHLLEHLLFRESKYLGKGEAIAAWQRLGATFGSDANAETSPTHTAYKLDIPNVDEAKLYESFKLLSGMIREPVLSDENVATDRPIVLAEKRERGGAQERMADLTRRTFFAGQRLSIRNPIGTVETLEAADGKKVRAFYERWYRPENTVVVVAGDADPKMLAGLVEQWFGDWKGTGEPGVAPDFGDPVAPADPQIDPATNVAIGELAVGVEPDMPRSFTYAIMRPWRPVQDTMVYNEGLMLDSLSQAIINRRLESRARSGGSFLYAVVEQDDISRSTDATFISFAPLSGDWQTALADVRSVIQDAITNPPTQQEIDREVAEYDIAIRNSVEQATLEAGADLADTLINAVDIRETVASPQTIQTLFDGMRHRFTPEEVSARTKALFEGDVVRSVYITPSIGEADVQSLQLALADPVAADGSARLAERTVTFDDLPPIGEPGEIVSREMIGVVEVEQLEFDNGVKALVWSSEYEPGRATVKVRFGAGYRGFDKDSAPYATIAEFALIASGIGELGEDDIDRLVTGRKIGFEFAIEDAVFSFTSETRREDINDQLYLFAAKLANPRWDANPVLRAKAASELAYNSFAASPAGVINRDLNYLVTDRDPRFATPSPEALKDVTPEGFRKVWEPLLRQGPVEVLVFGDFELEAVVEQLQATFGALPAREPIAPEVANRVPRFPDAGKKPVVLEHRGDSNQAAAVIAWRTGGGIASLREGRQLEILTQLFNNRLMEVMREKAGASYSPQVWSSWPVDIQEGGTVTAFAQLTPEFVPVFFAEAERIARDLADNPATADELQRVTGPLGEQIRRASTGYHFLLYSLEGATDDPQRIRLLSSIVRDYSTTSPSIMQFLADRYFGQRSPLKLAVIPEGQELAEAPAGALLQNSAVRPVSTVSGR